MSGKDSNLHGTSRPRSYGPVPCRMGVRSIVGLAGRTRTCGLLVPNEARWPAALQRVGGDGRSPTDALLLARQALSRLSYVPDAMVQTAGLEPAPRRWQRRALPVKPCLHVRHPRFVARGGLPARTKLCHIRIVKEQTAWFRTLCRRGTCETSAANLWHPTRVSNPEMRVSETRAYADSASGAQKSPGALRRNPGLVRTQPVCALRSFLGLDCGRDPIAALERGRDYARLWRCLAACRHVQSCPHRLTRHRPRSPGNKKARSARAVRATDRSRAALLERRSRIRGGLAAALQRSSPHSAC